MNWHYVENGQSTGPVGDEQLAELGRTGKINADTLVWHEGMADWLPYGQINAGPRPAGTGAPRLTLAAAGSDPGATAACAECGKIFPVGEMIPYGNSRICANCKPVFMQKLAEGAPVNTGQMNYAKILTRFAAVFLDGLILWVVSMVINLIAGLGMAQSLGTAPRGFNVFYRQIRRDPGENGLQNKSGHRRWRPGHLCARAGPVLCQDGQRLHLSDRLYNGLFRRSKAGLA